MIYLLKHEVFDRKPDHVLSFETVTANENRQHHELFESSATAELVELEPYVPLAGSIFVD